MDTNTSKTQGFLLPKSLLFWACNKHRAFASKPKCLGEKYRGKQSHLRGCLVCGAGHQHTPGWQ